MTRGPRIAVIGGGKMGEAILSGWLRSQAPAARDLGPQDLIVVNPGQERRDHIHEAYGVECVADAADIPADTTLDLVVLAVKPQVMMGVLQQLAALAPFQGGASGPLFVSIAAGLCTDSLLQALPDQAPLVRVMPNTPLQVEAGASGVCGSATSTPEQVEQVRALFGCLGSAVAVSEDAMDAVGALSGSGPAYVAAMIEALVAAAQQEGLDGDLAQDLALQTVLGTAQMIRQTGVTPEQARIAVCSPGGTTLAALDAMDKAGFDEVFAAGLRAAVRRSKELAECTC